MEAAEQEQPILSKELKEDEDLKLSNKLRPDIQKLSHNTDKEKSVKEIIGDSIQEIDLEKLEGRLNVLNQASKEPISCPNNYVFVSLADRVYDELTELAKRQKEEKIYMEKRY